MERQKVKDILIYYRNIPGMIDFEEKQYKEIEDKYYSPIKSPKLDGLPRSQSFTGDQTQTMGIKAAKDNAGEELKRHDVRISILRSDQEEIRNCLDGINGVYKKIISDRYIHGYSWAKISIRLRRPDSTVRNWHDRAIDKLGKIFEEDIMMIDELAERAARAR